MAECHEAFRPAITEITRFEHIQRRHHTHQQVSAIADRVAYIVPVDIAIHVVLLTALAVLVICVVACYFCWLPTWPEISLVPRNLRYLDPHSVACPCLGRAHSLTATETLSAVVARICGDKLEPKHLDCQGSL